MIIVSTTADKREALERIGRRLLEKRLVACIQIGGPIKSIYWWKGALEEVEEWVATMKTRKELYDQVEREVRALHPYEVPEIVAVEAENVLAEYEGWVLEETAIER
jgi:periplasmic divalent cation tolerance protein